jgi:uncharacterized membrane protein YphA (DoxX/SURF4 family)
MLNGRALSNLAIRVYGLAAIAEGLVGLVWGDFATDWWPVQALPFNLHHRAGLSYIVAICFLFGGVAILWRRAAQSGVVVLSILYFISALLWMPRMVEFPRILGTWCGFMQQFSLVASAMVAYASLMPRDSASTVRMARIGRFLYAICVVSYGLVHFSDLSGTASVVPEWIPPGQKFWAAATGFAFLLASIAMFSGVLAVLASRLLTVMLVVFSALVWAPSLFTDPHVHLTWAGNAINLAFIGAAWVIADSLASRQEQIPN